MFFSKGGEQIVEEGKACVHAILRVVRQYIKRRVLYEVVEDTLEGHVLGGVLVREGVESRHGRVIHLVDKATATCRGGVKRRA